MLSSYDFHVWCVTACGRVGLVTAMRMLNHLALQKRSVDFNFPLYLPFFVFVQDVALFINEVKRDNETMQWIRQIQKSITDINMPQVIS